MMDAIDTPAPYDWCLSCDVPVDADRHRSWHAAGCPPVAETRARAGYSPQGARSLVRVP